MTDLRTRAIQALEGARFEDEAQRENVIKQVVEFAKAEIEACAEIADKIQAVAESALKFTAAYYPEAIAAAIRARRETSAP